MTPALEIRALTKTYGAKTAVDQLSLSVAPGEVFGLLGPNGAGKSTTLECVLGVKKQDSGTVRILGMDPKKERKKLFQNVGVQFQQGQFQEKITVAELCEVTASLYKNPADWRALLSTFGLESLKKTAVMECSGGERQRLCVLLALLPQPQIVFLDELTTGLDTKARRSVWSYLKTLKESGLTIVLTSHYMDEVEALCDRAALLIHGTLAAEGTIRELIDKTPCKTLEDAYLWYTGEEERE